VVTSHVLSAAQQQPVCQHTDLPPYLQTGQPGINPNPLQY
jgi:hypothetical protein